MGLSATAQPGAPLTWLWPATPASTAQTNCPSLGTTPPGACTDKYNRDWTRRLDSDYARVSYGHDIENVWLLMDACAAVGLSNTPLL